MIRSGMAIVLLAFGSLGLAQEAGYRTTWSIENDLQGFEVSKGTLSQTHENGNPGGFLRIERTQTIVPKPYLRSDLGKVFGHQPGTISFDLKAFGDAPIAGVSVFLSTGTQAFRIAPQAANIQGRGQSAADGWVRYSAPWSADWTDEEAIKAGWIPYSGVTDHWVEVIRNPIWSQIDVTYPAGTYASKQSLGLDNFQIEAGEILDAERLALIEPLPPQQEPVAHYAFDEGSGDLLHDRSGRFAPGQIHGAKWVRNGGAWALEFDGKESFVDLGEVRVLGPQSLITWVYAEPIYSVFLGVPILGDGGCQLYQHVHDVRGAGSGLLPFRKWTHIAQVWDGRTARLYIDGVLASVLAAQEPTPRSRFRIAELRPRAPGEPVDYERRFRGKVASVLLYNRPLTQDEVLKDLRTTNITHAVMPMPIPMPGQQRILVEVDAARLGQELANVLVDIDVLNAAENSKVLTTTIVERFDQQGRAVVNVPALDLPPGQYLVRTAARNADGVTLGVPGEEPLAWAGSARFPSGPPGARRLNNLVTELLNVADSGSAPATYRFTNPRRGFVHFSNRGAENLSLTEEDSRTTSLLMLSADAGDALETVRYLPAGDFSISIAGAKDLTARAVAQTVYDYAYTQLPVNHPGYVGGFGPYHGPFEETHVFPHYNTLYVHDFNLDKPFVKEWKAKGRRIMADLRGGMVSPKDGQSLTEAIVETLGDKLPGFTHPFYDGCIFDEWAGSTPEHRDWAQAIDVLFSRPKLSQRSVHMWSYAIYDLLTYDGGEPGRELVAALQRHHCPVQWECYLHSQRTELAAWRHINDKIVGEARAAEQIHPGFVQNLIMAPYAYVNAGPPWLTMTQPGYDVRTFIEMQIRTVATDPTFSGIEGLGVYRSPYADEEITRWTAQLMRHYAIEGNTEPLGHDPFVLSHVQNGDFEEQERGWKIEPAEEDSIRFELHHQFGSIQGRYTGNQGDTVLITRRSATAANVVSQELKDIEPGRLYSFRMFSADHRNLTQNVEHPLHIEFENAEIVPEKSFTHIGQGTRPGTFVNWHVRVFRAKENPVILRISDWKRRDAPEGEIGQELMHNFVKVQPYWSE